MSKRIRILGLSVLAMASSLVVTQTTMAQPGRGGSTKVWEFLAEKYDKDNDGKLTNQEYDRSDEKFKRFDRNGDGVLTADDWKSAPGRSGRGSQRLRGGGSPGAPPAKGDAAPEFDLSTVKNESKTVQLSSFVGKQPVALIFGSCT